jgi:hypothetical protein
MGPGERGGARHRWGTVTGVALVVALLVVAIVSQLSDRGQRPAAPPTEVASSSSPTPSPTPTDAAAPTDAEARRTAEAFMRDLWQQKYEHAWSMVCGNGQQKYANGAALQKALGLVDRSIAGYTITKIRPASFNGDARKVVAVDVTYAPEGSGTLNLSVTQDQGEPTICGW